MSAVVAVLLLLLPAVLGQPATESAPPAKAEPDAALMADLEEIDARGAKIEDLTADFEQQKFTALLKKPLVSEGKVRMRPPRTRWDTTKPHKSVLLLDDHVLKLYDPEAATVEVYEVSGGLSRMTASPVPRLSAVKDEFSIERIDPADMDAKAKEASSIAIRLTPRDTKLREHVSEVKVLIDRAFACAVRVEVSDADGDRTIIRFTNLKLNSGLDAATLELKLPEGTKVSHPLEGMGAGGAGGMR